MRTSHEVVIKAFLEGKDSTRGNLSSEGFTLCLYGYDIARRSDGEFWVRPAPHGVGPTQTTFSVLRTFLYLAGQTDWTLSIVGRQGYFHALRELNVKQYGIPVKTDHWYSILPTPCDNTPDDEPEQCMEQDAPEGWKQC